MKVFALRARSLLMVEPPTSLIISRREFEAWDSEQNQLRRIRNKGAQYLQAVRMKRANYIKSVKSRMAIWETEQKEALQEKMSEACQNAIRESLEWFQQMQSFEEALYPKLLQKAVQWVSSVIEKNFKGLNLSPVLAKTLEEYLSGEPEALVGTLKIHPDDEAELKRWGEIFQNLRIEVDSDLALGSATLRTEFFMVHLSVGEQLKKVLEQINTFSKSLYAKNLDRALEPQACAASPIFSQTRQGNEGSPLGAAPVYPKKYSALTKTFRHPHVH